MWIGASILNFAERAGPTGLTEHQVPARDIKSERN
jgi:hypothetical protein